MTTPSNAVAREQRSRRLSAADVHSVLFTRAGLGRRGYDETEVDVFLDHVQAELTRLVAEKAELRDEITRLRSQVEERGVPDQEEGEPSREEASIQAVRILSVAQQTADQYVADAEHYSRRISSDAREHYEEMVREARARARAILEEADRITRQAPGEMHVDAAALNGSGKTKQELEQQVAYLRTFGEVCRVQLRSYLESLLRAIEDEWGRADPRALTAGGFGTGPGQLILHDQPAGAAHESAGQAEGGTEPPPEASSDGNPAQDREPEDARATTT